MSNIIVGTVAAMSAKELSSGTYYSVCVKTDSGDLWFRTGKKQAPCQKGNRVKFSFTEDKYGKHMDLASLQSKEGEAVETKAAGKAAGKTDWDAKDKKITYMAVLKEATPIVMAATELGYLGIAKSKKPAEKYELFLEQIKAVADELYKTVFEVPDRHDEIMASAEELEAEFDTNMSDEVPPEDEVEEDGEW